MTHNDLAYYDIIDVTPGTNSDFVKKRSKDDIDNSDIKELIVKLVKEPDFQKGCRK
ncbi:15468_t:CDS:2 [Rhizophagus irregularis]|nr:15468_t:CDS:2 [Rhizophagus irregularis]